MKRILCAASCALLLSACGNAPSEDDGELATAKAETAAAKAENAAMKAEMAASGSSDESAAPTPSLTPQKVAAKDAPKPAAKPTGNGKYRAPTADELANGVNANCDIAIEAFTYSGPCLFDGFGGASFTVSRADGYPMHAQFEEVIVEADTNKIAMMSIRDAGGNLEGIGQVSRASTRDACWTGDMTKVCAYGKEF